MTRAPLAPAEVLVLLDPNRPQGAAALKVTLIWLLAAGFLRTEETKKAGLFGRKKPALRYESAKEQLGTLDADVLARLR
jgi:hypothetical protein